MELKKFDIVLIHYNNTLGRIINIHGWAPLHDVEGLDGLMYGNQLGNELDFIRGLNERRLDKLAEWVGKT